MSTSPSPTATTSAPAKPLSPFEHDAPVKAARGWASALGRAVNAHDTSMQSLRHWVTDHGRTMSQQEVASDLQHHYTWPGPQPFTPVHVAVDGDAATIAACALGRGWSQDKSGAPVVHKRTIWPVEIRLMKAGGSWKVDALYSSQADCGGVRVPGVKW